MSRRRRIAGWKSGLLELLAPPPVSYDAASDSPQAPDRHERTREKMRAMLATGELDSRKVELTIEQKSAR